MAITRFKTPPEPTHVEGTNRGESLRMKKGAEPGRACGRSYRSARDSTSINSANRQPILPSMPNIPPP